MKVSKVKVNREQLATDISAQLNVEKQFIELVIDYFSYNVRKQICAGETVHITGLGTFKQRHKKATNKHDINTGLTIPIPAKNIIIFEASKKLIEQANNGGRVEPRG